MKAFVSIVAGGPEALVLENVPDPVPGPENVVVEVKACGINFPDLLFMRDLYQIKLARPFTPGAEVSGVVVAVGDAVERLQCGDRVLGCIGWGGLAELVCRKASNFIPIPPSMPFSDAASFAFTYATAYYALHSRARLQRGETVLILGAAGGVGIAALELAKAAGARVIAGVSSEEKASLVRERGADAVVIYRREAINTKEMAEQFKVAVGKSGADVVVDPVGGDYAEPALRTMGWEGRYLVIGFAAGIPRFPLNLVLLKSCQVVGIDWRQFLIRDPGANDTNLKTLFQLYEQGYIQPSIHRRFSFSRARDALAMMESRSAMGKLVVEF
jgi:NADPH2:quinone reductase